MAFIPREQFLANLANEYGCTRGVELGVWKGQVFKYLLDNCPQMSLTGVDLYAAQPDNDGPEKWVPGENNCSWEHEDYYRDILKVVEKHKFRARFIRDWTTEASKQFENESIDFIFIDADHSEKGVRADIEHWLPKVKKGGIIAGHDYDWEGVEKVVKETFGDEFTVDAFNIWWTRKK